jgi:hypothetical protein
MNSVAQSFSAAFGIGLPMTRHPTMGAAGKPEVAVRILIENKARSRCELRAANNRRANASLLPAATGK